jgi:hypothetical protein
MLAAVVRAAFVAIPKGGCDVVSRAKRIGSRYSDSESDILAQGSVSKT